MHSQAEQEVESAEDRENEAAEVAEHAQTELHIAAKTNKEATEVVTDEELQANAAASAAQGAEISLSRAAVNVCKLSEVQSMLLNHIVWQANYTNKAAQEDAESANAAAFAVEHTKNALQKVS